MRSITAVVVGVLSLVSLAGCNSGQPRIFRVALDNGAPLAPSCRKDSTTTTPVIVSEANFRTQDEWVLWDGPTTQFLDMGKQEWKLGDSPKITVEDLIEGGSNGSKSFQATRTVLVNVLGVVEKRTTQVVVAWSDYGTTPTGTVDLRSQYECTGCATPNPAPDSVSCATTINFVGRRIDAAPTTMYSNNPL